MRLLSVSIRQFFKNILTHGIQELRLTQYNVVIYLKLSKQDHYACATKKHITKHMFSRNSEVFTSDLFEHIK